MPTLFNAAVQALNVGQTLSDTFTVTTVDGTQQVVTILIHGTNDSLVPFNGRRFTPLMPRMLPFSAARDFWKSSNGTNESTQTEVKPGVIKETHVNKKSGNEVVVYTLKGNGHGWPGRPDSIDGKPCLKVKGEDLIWDFFSKHKKAG